jgi:hypothetical protein
MNQADSAILVTIANTGAATFSSSVSTGSFISSGGRGTTFGYRLPDWQIYNTTSGNGLAFSNYTTDCLTLASSGAATFSSSVTAGVITGDSNSTGVPSIVAKVGSGGNNGTFGFGNSTDYRIRGGSDYGAMIFDTAGSERMRIDSSGNFIFKNDSTTNQEIFYGLSQTNGNCAVIRWRNTGLSIHSYGQSYGSQLMIFPSSANVGIGTTTDSGYKLRVSYNGTVTSLGVSASDGGVYLYTIGTGIVYSNAGVLTSTNPSDSRLKDKIADISWGLNEILKLRPVSYSWKDDKVNQGMQFGFIAQEVKDVMPEAIKEFGDAKYLGLEKDAIYATLVKAIQELEARIKQLENK